MVILSLVLLYLYCVISSGDCLKNKLSKIYKYKATNHNSHTFAGPYTWHFGTSEILTRLQKVPRFLRDGLRLQIKGYDTMLQVLHT